MSGFVAILICLVLSAFFSGMEIAFMASNKLRIEIDKSNKGITQKLIDLFVSNSGMYITTILVGNNVVMVIYGIFMSDYLDPRLEDVRIAYGVAGPIPMRAVHAEEAGRGKEVSARILEEIAEQVLFDIHPRDSWRASKAFREHIARVLCQRALKEAIVRTGGVIHE